MSAQCQRTPEQNLIRSKEAEQKLLKRLFPNYQINLQQDFNKWDLLEHNRKYIIEIKVRECSYRFYQEYRQESPLIEVEKYKANIAKAKELGYKFIYIFAFRNEATGLVDTYQAYNLTDLQPEAFELVKFICPESSFIPDSRQVIKDCFIINQKHFNQNNRVTRTLRNPF